MNVYYLVAAIVSFMAVFGHFAMGTKMYIRPVMDSDADAIPKNVMLSLFHYMSVFMILTTIVLFASAFEYDLFRINTGEAVLLVGISYGGFALAQFFIALFSSVKAGIFKMFQWVFWLIISVSTLLGYYL